MDISLSTVQDAFSEARALTEAEKKRETTVVGFRLHVHKKDIFNKICEQNGVRATDFLQICVDKLIEEFMGPRAYQNLQRSCGELPELTDPKEVTAS